MANEKFRLEEFMEGTEDVFSCSRSVMSVSKAVQTSFKVQSEKLNCFVGLVGWANLSWG